MGWEGRFGKAEAEVAVCGLGGGGGGGFLGACMRDSCYDQGGLHKVIDECETFFPALATLSARFCSYISPLSISSQVGFSDRGHACGPCCASRECLPLQVVSDDPVQQVGRVLEITVVHPVSGSSTVDAVNVALGGVHHRQKVPHAFLNTHSVGTDRSSLIVRGRRESRDGDAGGCVENARGGLFGGRFAEEEVLAVEARAEVGELRDFFVAVDFLWSALLSGLHVRVDVGAEEVVLVAEGEGMVGSWGQLFSVDWMV